MEATLAGARGADAFQRHVYRLAWFAALGSCTLLMVGSSVSSRTQLVAAALAASTVLVALVALVRETHRYVRRVSTLRSASAGYTQSAATPPHLSDELRGRVANASGAAEGITECPPAVSRSQAPRAPFAGFKVAAPGLRPTGMWLYDPQTRRVQTLDGVGVAHVSEDLDDSVAPAAGTVLSAAPEMWQVLGEAQRAVTLVLARGQLHMDDEMQMRSVLEALNQLHDRIRV